MNPARWFGPAAGHGRLGQLGASGSSARSPAASSPGVLYWSVVPEGPATLRRPRSAVGSSRRRRVHERVAWTDDRRHLPRRRLGDAAARPRRATRSSRRSTASATRCTSTRRAGERAACSTTSRATVASAIGAQPDEIVFTSGGTESVALAIWGGVRAMRELGTRIVVSAVEHPAVGGVGHVLRERRVRGRARPGRRPTAGSTSTATPREVRVPGHPARERAAREPRARHDAAGRRGRPARARGEGAVPHRRLPDGRAASGRRRGARRRPAVAAPAHKFGGPPGVGALYVRRGVGDHRLPVRRRPRAQAPLRHGEHARHRRDGGGALAPRSPTMADAAARQWALTARLRDRIEATVPGATVHGHPTHRTPHLVCFSVDGLDPADADDGPRRSRVPRGGGLAVHGPARGPSPVLEQIGRSGRAGSA